MNQRWKRRLTYGTNATLVTFFGIAILILLYAMVSQNRVRWDLTEEGRNTLSQDMIAKVALLDADAEAVQITAFSAQRGKGDASFKNRAIKDLLRELGARSKVIDWRLVDFDKDRLTAERLGVTEYGHVVVQRGADRVDIRARDLFRKQGKADARHNVFLGEAAFARSFSQLHTPKRRVVYVLSGHGELDPADRGPSGLADLADALDIERYDVEVLDLISSSAGVDTPRVPDDAAAVLIPAARTELGVHEADALLTYLSGGGGLLLALEPGSPVPDLLGRLGISVPSGVAMDRKVVFPFWDRPIPRVKQHETTQGLREGKLTPVLARVAPLMSVDPAPDGMRTVPVLTTSRDGWIERGGVVQGGSPIYEPDIDGAGPVYMALATEVRPGRGLVRTGKRPARIFTVGDSDFLSNGLLSDGPGNVTFTLDVVHWLAGADLRVASVGARKKRVRRLAITKEQLGTLRWLSMGFLPVLVGIVGFAVRTNRRGR
ncbi:MAG: hypothetical protein CL930_08950 [Deltaproteobacteria bacterium]|nr:hypothetical protein [Deltaproteobacteria bacterium]